MALMSRGRQDIQKIVYHNGIVKIQPFSVAILFGLGYLNFLGIKVTQFSEL